MQKLLTFLLIINCYSLSAQDDDELVKNTWMIYTSPLQAIDLFSVPKSTLGIEYIDDNTFGYAFEMGVKNAFDKIYNVDYNDYKTIKERAYLIRFEFKIYDKLLFMKNSWYRDYVGLEYRYLNSNYNDVVKYFPNDGTDTEPDDDEYINDYFGVKKKINIINLKYGAIINISKHFYLDIYAGFGLRNKNVENVNREFDWYNDYFKLGNHDYGLTFKRLEESSGNYFNVSLGGKFGYRF